MQVDARLNELKSRIDVLERLVGWLTANVNPPIFYHSGQQHCGYRFGKPDFRHFCLLKGVRAVSALNASACLAGAGYNQELCVIIRTIVECNTHINYVLAGLDSSGNLTAEALALVENYFADFARNSSADFRRPKVRQKSVHETIADAMKRDLESAGIDAYHGVDSKQLMSNVYLTFSNYVHCRYPETMDLYGGDPQHFHLDGMRGTPKDSESIAILECYVDDVSLALTRFVQKGELRESITNDPMLAKWYDGILTDGTV